MLQQVLHVTPAHSKRSRHDAVTRAPVPSQRCVLPLSDDSFVLPDDFDPSDYMEGGRVFFSGETEAARVRYSPVIAPWIREKGPCEELADGSVAVSYSAADPGWVVRHVLQYGTEAELLEPASARDLVVASARRLLEGGAVA